MTGVISPNIMRRRLGLAPARPWVKHVMKLEPKPNRPHWVFFQCQNCDAGVAFDRPVWYDIVVNRNPMLKEVLKRSWANCRNDGSRPPTPYPQELENP